MPSKNCNICNKTMIRPKRFGIIRWEKRIYCSNKCRFVGMNGHITTESTKKKISNSNKGKTGHIAWNKGLHIKTNNALVNWIKEGNCWNRGLKGYNAGEKHYNWKGGTSKEGYTYQFRYKLREKIRKLYQYRCQQCFRHQDELYDSNGKKYKLSVHHIDYNKKNNSISNLIPLCSNCHTQTNFKRNDWINYFKEKKMEANYV